MHKIELFLHRYLKSEPVTAQDVVVIEIGASFPLYMLIYAQTRPVIVWQRLLGTLLYSSDYINLNVP